MIDQPPEQQIGPDYPDYPDSMPLSGREPGKPYGAPGEVGAAAPVGPLAQADTGPVPVAPQPTAAEALAQDTFARHAVALAQVLTAPLSAEQALGEALRIGLSLLPATQQLAVYVAPGASPVDEGGWTRVAKVERTRHGEDGDVDLSPRRARTLGLGSEVDRRALRESSPIHTRAGVCAPLSVIAADGAVGWAGGALVLRWQEAAHAMSLHEPAGLSLLAPCCAALLARQAHVEAERRIAGSLALLPKLQAHLPVPRAPEESMGATPAAILDELAVVRPTADALQCLLDTTRCRILMPLHDGTWRVHPGSAEHEQERAVDVLDDPVLTQGLNAAIGASDLAVIENSSPLAKPLCALLGVDVGVRSGEHERPGCTLLFAVHADGRLAAVIALGTIAAAATVGEMSMAQAEVALAGATLLAKRLSLLAAADEQARDAFLSLAVHELRSPLTAVKGYAQLLLRQSRRMGLPEPMGQAIVAIEEQASRMADMITEMHDAVRVRRGDLELHRESVELAPLVAEAIEQIRKLFPQHTFALLAENEPLMGDWDPQRVVQVVAALVSNAARFSPDGGAVDVRVARDESGGQPAARVCVRDKGVGIDEADRDHIFDYLYRSPEAKRRNLSGLGLGLFVSRAVVERMGGRLWLAQTQPAAGSTFCLLLPLHPPV